jgi:mono/diheme cytochrome c family protein
MRYPTGFVGRILVVAVLACAAATLGAQAEPQPPRNIDSLQQKPGASKAAGSSDQGAQLFRTYCAACHGANGRGAGPASEQFRKIPPDLTKYTVNNGGVFPSERVRRIIDGTGVAAHGDRDMPVWGDAFQGGREGLTAEAAKARIDLIVRFLESIQARAAH